MQYLLDWNVSYANVFEMVYSQYFLHCCFNDGSCLDNGKDVTEGGAKYNRTGLTACGTSNVGDSLMSIKSFALTTKLYH